MSFCKKRLHSFLSFTNLSDSPPPPPATKCPIPCASGIGLMTAAGETCRPPNVLEAATVRPPPLPPALFDNGGYPRKEPDGILTVRFFEEVGEVVNGLMSCTESLGFESSDERRVDEDSRSMGDGGGDSLCVLLRAKRREESERIRERRFPPPLTSLNDKGRPSFFLKPVRRDGRLELTEVRIERPETLRASRGDGRLRLEFIKDPEFVKDPEFIKDPEFKADNEGMTTEDVTKDDEVKERMTILEEDDRSKERRALISGKGFGRCHEAIVVASRGGHDNHNLHVWRQRCVTIG